MNVVFKSTMIFTFVFFLINALAMTGIAQKPLDSAKDFYEATLEAPAAFTAGDMARARSLSQHLLKEAETWKDDWNYGNAIHTANLVLGRIALLNKEFDKARNYLREAGKTPGSPQLNSFGPDMLFASEMLNKGETEAVLEYFELCGKFWVDVPTRLQLWKAQVKSGSVPDFGPNLRYIFRP